MSFRPHLWRTHPAVRSEGDLTLGERAADRMKAAFATWTALGSIVVAMAVWMATDGLGADKPPWIGLNLCLSCIAALQCFVLLIASRRTDQISSELAQHDYETDREAKEILKQLALDFGKLQADHAAMGELLSQVLRDREVK